MTERRRSRTDPATGYAAWRVLKTRWATGPVPLRRAMYCRAVSEEGVSSLIHQTLLGDAWEHAAAAISIFSDDGRYIACNRAFCELSGYTRDEIVQMRVGVDLAADGRNMQLFEDIVGSGRTRGGGGLKRKDGVVVEVDVEAIATTVAGLPYHIVLYFESSTSTS